MKVPNKEELQQIAFNHSSDIDSKDFMNFYKRYTAQLSSLVFDANTAPDNLLRFNKNRLKRI